MGTSYTYQGGRKVALRKRDDQFVVRARPEEVRAAGYVDAERVSSGSVRVSLEDPSTLDENLAAARENAVAHHAYEVEATGKEFLITDRVIVTFKEPRPAQQVAEFAGRYGLVQLEAYSDRAYLFQLTDHTGMNPVKLVVKLTEEEPGLASAEHDLNVRAAVAAFTTPTDPAYARQWHLQPRVQSAQVDPRSCSGAEDAWRLLDGFGSDQVVVGLTDDGCKIDHPDFDSGEKFAGWGYFQGTRLVRRTDVDADSARMYETGANHGTSCAGVIAAELDASLTVGGAPGCRLVPVKWESSGPSLFISTSKLRTALDYVADKVDVLSNSWGISPETFWPTIVTDRIRELAATGGRRGKGILFLWAAGNENCPIQHAAAVDVPYTHGWESVAGAPQWVGVETSRQFSNSLVGIPGVLHVAALASTAKRSHYSNYGTGIDLCAPTSNSHSYWRLQVPGLGITTTTGPEGSTTNPVTEGFGGTSSATPLTAAVAALVISANPDLTAVDVASILRRTASKDLDMQGYARTPPASYDPNPTWDVSPVAPFDTGAFRNIGHADGTWSPWFGNGRVDARAAVAEGLARRAPTAGATRRYSSSPEIPIPDNNAAGIRNVIAVTDAGRVRDIRVRLDIVHSWIGDLSVQLIAPNGTTVAIHERAGGNADNISRLFTVVDVPGLAALRDVSITGNWTLAVRDLAAQDVGLLRKWELEVDVVSEPIVIEDAPGIVIPDANATGVIRRVQVQATQPIRDVAVSVDITHTWIGDLSVLLVAPSGESIVLHNRTGGEADNVVKTWRSADVQALRVLRGRSPAGEWRLHVADLEAADVGKLNRWRLELTV